ncbi:protein IQ-DOMAIN 19-like [Mercurialis annua]|uniref:protein IQ-DOMAIN 19-like n=1 Tax=Mercurialis annua TaxID=3986 RepID=UPI00215E31E4|nr:protein IQ-DOMAIN 19-like [Mercurialis annua]
MGKASRWIINFLLGKKEEKEKRKNISFYEDYGKTPTRSIPSSSPTYKRRWSFRKSASKEKVHKTSNSFDSIAPLNSITPLITQYPALLEWKKLQANKNKASVAEVCSPAEAIKRVVSRRHEADHRIIRLIKAVAATRIQSAYRSHLARKALCALKALVKIQALVRGHLVRKQTSATLRQMHALISIQVRARFQRIQKAEESALLVVRSQASGHGSSRLDNGLIEAYTEKLDLNSYETKKVLKDKHGILNHSQMERREHGVTKYYSGELYISRKERERERDFQCEDFSFPTVPNSPRIYSPPTKALPGRASFTYQKPDYMQPISHPNYMANTESSRAKLRSQSEPKQRPNVSTKPKNEQQHGQLQGSSFYSTPFAYENQDPWFINSFRSNRSKDSKFDAKSTASSTQSNYKKLLATYESNLNLY